MPQNPSTRHACQAQHGETGATTTRACGTVRAMANEPRVALVTGAGSGIGRAVAAGMLEHGYAVVLAGRRREALEDAARSSGASAERAACVPTDVTSESSVEKLFDEVRARFGRLDVLFNNAGVSAPLAAIDELTADAWRAVVDVNLTGVFLCTKHAFAQMKAQQPRGGRIINNGSLAAHVPRPKSAPYAATKHAVTGLTRATALDGRAFDIACGQIDIGNAATTMAAAHHAGALQPNGEIASEPLLDLAHVVDAVLYMAGLPLDANVPSLTVMASKMPFAGRG
jgi:NAD(P)-dependent dehydrogenase (short-subunit alcohol dehydrogenase family)